MAENGVHEIVYRAAAAMRSSELDQLATALSQAQAEFVAIPKDSTNPFFKSKYAGLPKVVEVASPILTKHGLAVSQFIGHDEGGDTLTTWLLHKSGQFISQSMRLHLAKDDAQGQGSATTYARRYSYMSVLGLVADVDDDGQGAVRKRIPMVRMSELPPETSPLSDEKVRELREAAAEAGVKSGWLRMQLVAAGVENVPDKIDEQVIRRLSPEQAQKLLGQLNALVDARNAKQNNV